LIEQENKNVSLTVNGIEFNQFEDFLLRPFFIKNQKISGELMFYADQNAISDQDFFMWDNDDEESLSLKEQASKLKDGKARSIFFYDSTLSQNLQKYGHYYQKSRTRLATDEVEKAQITIALSDEGLSKLFKAAKIDQQKLSKKGSKLLDKRFPLQFELNINKPNSELSGENVIAFIPGKKKPEELIVITAHYDHLGAEEGVVYNGADDDGTGTVSLMEIAQSFMLAVEAGFGPDRSILIMPVSGEEKGLLGSRYYTENPIFPLENTVANLNIDMIGRYDENHKEDSNYVYLIGSDKLSNDLHQISEKVNQSYSKFNLDYRYNDDNDPNRFYYRSDHYNFAKNNVPVIFYFSGVHEDYHKATDTVEKIDFNKTARIARLVFLTAWELANREERIKLNENL
jgi:Zn-dependent M28 family amino/carboxypeptidase